MSEEIPKNKIKFIQMQMRAAKKSRDFLKKHHPDIYAMQRQSRREGGLNSGCVQWTRLREIVNIVESIKPNSVCELGSGVSSILFAKLLKDKSKFVTYDESPEWRDKMLKLAGKYAKYIDARVAKRKVRSTTKEALVYYDFPKKEYCDILYIDGPTPSRKKGDRKDLVIPNAIMPCVDVEQFFDNDIYPKVIAIDFRVPTYNRIVVRMPNIYSPHPRTHWKDEDMEEKKVFMHHSFFLQRHSPIDLKY